MTFIVKYSESKDEIESITEIKLCPAVSENIIRLQVMDEESGEVYAEHVRKNITAQAEWERERVKEAIDKINYYSYDGEDENSNPKLHKILAGFLEDSYIRTEDFIVFLKELGIEQEEKKK